MKRSQRGWAQTVSLAVLILAAFIAIAIPLLDLLGVLENVEWFQSRIPIITLLAVGLLIGATVFERQTILARIEGLIRQIFQTHSIGIEYLKDSEAVISDLGNMVGTASENVMALGAKSTVVQYLDRIAGKSHDGDINYHRLLTGNHITHKLHEHLSPLLQRPNVHLAWNYSEKYGTLTVTEHQVTVVLPNPNPNKFVGIKLPGSDTNRLFSNFFMQAFAESTVIKVENSLQLLCEDCSPGVSRSEADLGKAISALENSGA